MIDLELDLDEREQLHMRVLIAKLAAGSLGQQFTAEEVALLAKLRENKETILEILHNEMKMVYKANAAGREKLSNLVRNIEKICR